MPETASVAPRPATARRRAVVMLHDVLRWEPSEIAELLQVNERSIVQVLRGARRGGAPQR